TRAAENAATTNERYFIMAVRCRIPVATGYWGPQRGLGNCCNASAGSRVAGVGEPADWYMVILHESHRMGSFSCGTSLAPGRLRWSGNATAIRSNRCRRGAAGGG